MTRILQGGPEQRGGAPATNITEQVFERLSEAIIRGELAPGAKISEPKLASQMGVSRAPLREAIRRLEGRKLVVSSPNLGARVAPFTREALLELFAIRAVLEGLAAREAAERITEGGVGELQRMLADHATALDKADGAVYFQEEANTDFHFFLARTSGNSLLIKLLCDEYYPLLRFYRMRHKFVPGRAQKAFEEHVQLSEAIAHRDGELAEMLMRRHVDRSSRALQATLVEDGQRGRKV